MIIISILLIMTDALMRLTFRRMKMLDIFWSKLVEFYSMLPVNVWFWLVMLYITIVIILGALDAQKEEN